MKFNPAAFTRAILGAAVRLHVAGVRLVVQLDDAQVRALKMAHAQAVKVTDAAAKAQTAAYKEWNQQRAQNTNLRTAAEAELKALGASL